MERSYTRYEGFQSYCACNDSGSGRMTVSQTQQLLIFSPRLYDCSSGLHYPMDCLLMFLEDVTVPVYKSNHLQSMNQVRVGLCSEPVGRFRSQEARLGERSLPSTAVLDSMGAAYVSTSSIIWNIRSVDRRP